METKTKNYPMRFEPKFYEECVECADKKGVNLATYIRMALKLFNKKH